LHGKRYVTAGPILALLRDEESTPKGFRRGTHRVCDPSKTYEKIKRFMPAMGITRVADVTGLDYVGIPVVTVCRPNSRSVAVSQGKGIDLIAATVSGLMESIETFHAERIIEPLRFASISELHGVDEETIDVDGLLRVSDSPFHFDISTFWIAGENLMDHNTVWVPLEIVHTNYTRPALPGTGYFFASSNGLASGNHYSEAISHAISEVVERDCLELWKNVDEETRHLRKIDLSTVYDDECKRIIDRYNSVRLAVAVWEITSDIGIPAFCCWLVDGEESDFIVPGIGSGCHPSRAVALSRALTEAAQMRLTLVSGSRDDLTWEDYKLGISPDRTRRFRERIQLSCGTRDFRNGVNYSSEYLYEDLHWQVERLKAAGITQVIAVNLTKPQTFNIPVVRVVIPGLECEDSFQPQLRTSAAIAEYRALP
jgi:YcaO-like protein with predicted kinase domain